MNIVIKKVEELKPYENNPRINDDAVKYVAESIKQFGFKQPCVITKDNVLVVGHTRTLAAKKLGIKEVPCIVADDLTEEQIKAYRLADNRVSQFSEWDLDKLNIELDDLKTDFNLEDLGFSAFLDDEIDYNGEPDLKDKNSGGEKEIECPYCGGKILL